MLKIKILGIGVDCISIFVEGHDEFIGYIGTGLAYFDPEILDWYHLTAASLLKELKPKLLNKEITKDDVLYLEVKTTK